MPCPCNGHADPVRGLYLLIYQVVCRVRVMVMLILYVACVIIKPGPATVPTIQKAHTVRAVNMVTMETPGKRLFC